MHGELVTDCYVFNLEHTTRPLVTFASPDHVTVLDYNDKNPSLLGAAATEARWASLSAQS